MKIEFKLGDKEKNKEITFEKQIAEKILSQQDRLLTLENILNNLPSGLSEWFIERLRWTRLTKNYIEVDIANTLYSQLFLPGDIIVKRNRDPKIGDVVEIGQRIDDNYLVIMVRILKVNLKEGTLYVQSITDPDSKGTIGIGNVIYVLDKVIEYESQEWKKVAKTFDMECDLDDVKSWVKQQIEYLEKTENFHDKENNLKKLNDRLKLIK